MAYELPLNDEGEIDYFAVDYTLSQRWPDGTCETNEIEIFKAIEAHTFERCALAAKDFVDDRGHAIGNAMTVARNIRQLKGNTA